jgi:hypothetical protein
MFGLQILDIAIGLIFVYLILALTCTAISEFIAGLIDRRSKNLQMGIGNLLDPAKTGDIVEKFYKFPLIRSLWEKHVKPSYIPARTFAMTIMNFIDVQADPANSGKVVLSIKNNVDIPEHLKDSLNTLLKDASGDINKLQANIETWFNEAMDRVSAWYKQRTQSLVLILALVVTVFSNADTLRIAKDLSNNPAMRDALVAQAQEYVHMQENQSQNPDTSQDPPQEKIKKNIEMLQGLGVQLGWKEVPDSGKLWFSKILGLLLTAFAVSLGAPFWFDMLKKIINIRSAGKSPREIKEKEAKEAKKTT